MNWNWTAIGVFVSIITVIVSAIGLGILFYNSVSGLENRLSAKIDNGNKRTDKVYEILIGHEGDIESTRTAIETFIEEHTRNHNNSTVRPANAGESNPNP